MQPGDTIGGRFVVARLAGSGGMGTVYEARDALTGEAVALKMLTADGDAAAERFQREAALLEEIEDPRVVRYVAHGATPSGDRYLVTEWLAGEDLAERLARGRLSVRESIAVCTRVARGLAALHERGIVHRDVKPSNVFLAGKALEGAKLLDLGIARPMPGDRITRTGVAIGTPGYMPPEQVRGDRVLDARTDVFALGCVLYECLTGAPPFAGEHAIAILARILLEPPPSPSEACPGLSPQLDALVLAMLATDPSERPSSGAAVARALERLEALPDDAIVVSSKVPSLKAITTNEQRVISVVMSAPLGPAATLSAEDSSDVERGLAEIARVRGADLSTLADGSLLVTFTGDGAATDRAMAAARAAIRVRELLPDLPLAIATGKMTISGRRDAAASIGEAIARAARALAASPSGVAIDGTTAQLLDARFEVTGEGGALELAGERSEGDDARTVLGHRTACVGRERELTTLSAIFEECAGDSVARAALLVGPPGIGKSRIRHELMRRLGRRDSPVTVWLARADAVGQGSPFAAIAQAIRRHAEILDGEPLLLRQAKLAAAVARSVPRDDRARVTETLAELVGAPFSDDEAPRLRPARLDPTLMGDEIRRAFEDFVRAECARQPLLFILEDLHWSDRPSVLAVDAVLRNLHDAPLMVLATARPEVHEVFPKLWRDRALVEVNVPELSRKASEKLARDVLGARATPATIELVATRAAGNAFYLEELIRAAGSGSSEVLPDTVLAMVHARIAMLEPKARRILRAASVFGQAFWSGGVEALVGAADAADLAAHLDALADRELLERRARSKFPDEAELSFRHALVRDAAYSMLTAEDLRAGHRLAGAWLEKAGELDAMVLAEHFEIGGKLDRALQHVRRAAEVALEGNDYEGVLARVERGTRIAAAGGLEVNLGALAAEAHVWRGEFAHAEKTAGEAMTKLAPGSAAWCAAASQLSIAIVRLARAGAARALAKELRAATIAPDGMCAYATAISRLGAWMLHAGEGELAGTLLEDLEHAALSLSHDPRAMGVIYTLRATALVCPKGDAPPLLEQSLEQMQLAVTSYLATGDYRRACVSRSNVGSAAIELGQLALAEESLVAAVAEAERMGLSVVLSARENLGKLLARTGRSDEAKRVLRALIDESVARGYPRGEGIARTYLAGVLHRTAELEAAEAEASRAIAVLEPMPAILANALGVRSRIRLARGAAREALEDARAAGDVRASLGRDLEEGDALVRLALAEALRANDRVDESNAAIRAAEARLHERAAAIRDASFRSTFLEVEDHARTIALARAWLGP